MYERRNWSDAMVVMNNNNRRIGSVSVMQNEGNKLEGVVLCLIIRLSQTIKIIVEVKIIKRILTLLMIKIGLILWDFDGNVKIHNIFYFSYCLLFHKYVTSL